MAMRLGMMLVAAATVACVGGRGAGGGGGGLSAAPIPLDQYCNRWAEMVCRIADDCGCLTQFGVGADGCAVFVRADCVDEVETPVSAGARSFRPDEAGRCVAGVRAVVSDCTIDGADEVPAACDELLVGVRAQGEACESDGDCVPGLECIDTVCGRRPVEGEACGDAGCASEHFCGDDGLCRRYRGEGGACPEGSRACDGQLYCDERTQTCEPYLGRGESCGHAPGACDSDLTCAEDQTCQPYPGTGESCRPSGVCAGDLFCDGEGVCRAPRGEAEACTEPRQCASVECQDGACVGEVEDPPDTDGCDLL